VVGRYDTLGIYQAGDEEMKKTKAIPEFVDPPHTPRPCGYYGMSAARTPKCYSINGYCPTGRVCPMKPFAKTGA